MKLSNTVRWRLADILAASAILLTFTLIGGTIMQTVAAYYA